MARCSADGCQRWYPDLLVRGGAGTTIDNRWFCSEGCVEQTTRRRLLDARPMAAGLPAVPPVRLGVLLRHRGAVAAADIDRALEAQRQSGMKLGAQLQSMGVIDGAALVQSLAQQAGVSYLTSVEPSIVRDAPGRLSPGAVRALGLVPIREPENNRIKVACTAPVPRVACGVLRRLTGWTVEPYLVSDENWTVLARAYGESVTEETAGEHVAEFIKASSLSDAAARIASAASRRRTVSLTEAVCGPFTWVRVRGDGLVRDVIVDNDEQEDTCPVASTLH
jgi:hypothetical protein